MLDPTFLFPGGTHPRNLYLDKSGLEEAKAIRRAAVPNLKYYFIDFGMSSHFEDPNGAHRVLGQDGQCQDVPELSSEVPYDPFPADVFILGDLYKRYFTDVRSNCPIHLTFY